MIVLDTNDLRELLHAAGDDPVLTLYLPVDTSDPENHRDAGARPWEVQLRNDLHRLQVEAGSDRAAADRFAAARTGVERFLEGYQPGGRTLVLVADPDSVIDIEVPVVLQQRAAYGRPAVGEFARALSEHRLYAAVLVDRQSARLVAGAMGFVNDIVTLRFGTGWGDFGPATEGHQLRFESRLEEYQHKHQRFIAEQVDRFVLAHPEVDRLVLGGTADQAHGVARALGKRASHALVGVIPMPVNCSDADLVERIRPLAEQVEHDVDWAVVSGLHAVAGAGRAVFGLRAVGDALASGVVQQVVVSSHLDDVEVVEDIVGRALHAGAEVTFVHQDAATDLDPTDGVAARLYYAAVVVP